MSKKGNRSVYLAALILFVGGLGWLIFSGLSQNSVYFVNVSEALAVENLDAARLFGAVDGNGIERPQAATGVTFRLLDKDDPAKSIRVEYRGAVPDTFKPGVEVIVEGRMSPDRDVFKASTLMTKCPSKYKKLREGELKG